MSDRSRWDDAYIVTGAIPPMIDFTRPETTVPVIDLPAHPADYLTMTGVIEVLGEGSQMPREARSGAGRTPMRYVVLLFLGLVLMGVGMAREPLGLLVWSLLNV